MIEARNSKISQEDFLRLLLGTQVLIPSRQEVQADLAGLAPMVLESDGTPFVAVFTSLPRLPSSDKHSFCLEMVTSALLPRLPAGYGLVVNPGDSLRMELSPSGIQNIIKDLL